MGYIQGYFYQISKGGGFEILGLFDKCWPFSKNCGPFSMPQGSEVQVS